MKIIEETLYIDSHINNAEIEILKDEIIQGNLLFSKVIIHQKEDLTTSALISFLVSLKNTYPHVEIPFLQERELALYDSVIFITKGY